MVTWRWSPGRGGGARHRQAHRRISANDRPLGGPFLMNGMNLGGPFLMNGMNRVRRHGRHSPAGMTDAEVRRPRSGLCNTSSKNALKGRVQKCPKGPYGHMPVMRHPGSSACREARAGPARPRNRHGRGDDTGPRTLVRPKPAGLAWGVPRRGWPGHVGKGVRMLLRVTSHPKSRSWPGGTSQLGAGTRSSSA